MSKKKKKTIEAVANNQTVPNTTPIEEKMDLLSACQRYLKDFKFGWLHGIKRHADSHGMGLIHTSDEWKTILKSWGGTLKD